VTVRDAAGQPVAGAELAVVVVDEAVLALTGYSRGRPDRGLLQQRAAGATDHHLRARSPSRPDDQALGGDRADGVAAR
jgi:uncharacterized protein YfaS (alpha-2-macroglobulin family)